MFVGGGVVLKSQRSLSELVAFGLDLVEGREQKQLHCSLDLTNPDIVDIKPANMEDLTEVITASEFHPHHCNLFVYSSSKGSLRLCDMRAAALCDKHSKRKSLRWRGWVRTRYIGTGKRMHQHGLGGAVLPTGYLPSPKYPESSLEARYVMLLSPGGQQSFRKPLAKSATFYTLL